MTVEKVMMLCGCSSMSYHVGAHDGLPERHPSCIIHSTCLTTDAPDLSNRKARCHYYGKMPYKNECNYGGVSNKPCSCEQDSSLDLPFFEYYGPRSYKAVAACKNCKYEKMAHERKRSFADTSTVCSNFEPHGPYEFDSFYCGCQSWD